MKALTLVLMLIGSHTLAANPTVTPSSGNKPNVFVEEGHKTVRPGLFNFSTGCDDAKDFAQSNAKIHCYQDGYANCMVLSVAVLSSSTAEGGIYSQVGGCHAKAVARGNVLAVENTYVESAHITVEPGFINSSGCSEAKKNASDLAIANCVAKEGRACDVVETLVTSSSEPEGGDYAQVGGCNATSIARPAK